MKAHRLGTDIFCIEDFFSEEECNEWIAFSEQQGYALAKIDMGFRKQVVNTAIRNNTRVIHDSEALALEVWQKIRPFVIPETEHGVAYGVNERFRFYKYTAGQQFRTHRDGSYIKSIKEWSAYTLIIYLNEEIEGGETQFEDFAVVPKKGAAILFRHAIVHAGLPIKKGVKYVLRTDIMYRRKETD